MLSKLLKHWGLYVALLVLFGPILLIWVIEPDWGARVVGMSLFVSIPPLICLCYALGPNQNLLDIGKRESIWPSYIIRRIGERGVDVVTKTLIFGAGLVLTALLTLPFFRDLLLIISHKAPIERTAYVVHTRSLSANISEEVVLDTYPELSDQDDLTAWYFAPRHIMKGNTYTFLILPHSRIIIEAIPVEIINR